MVYMYVCMHIHTNYRTIQESDHTKFEVDGVQIRNSLCVPLRTDSGQVFAVLQVMHYHHRVCLCVFL
jgi:GAF domain-containing protein